MHYQGGVPCIVQRSPHSDCIHTDTNTRSLGSDVSLVNSRQSIGDEMRRQTWRWTELLQILKVTTTGSPSLRRLSWKLPWRPSSKSCHKNTSTRRWWTSPSSWLPAVVTWASAVTLSICPSVPIWPILCWWDVKPYSINQSINHLSISKTASSFHHRQETNWTDSLQSYQQKTHNQNAEKWVVVVQMA